MTARLLIYCYGNRIKSLTADFSPDETGFEMTTGKWRFDDNGNANRLPSNRGEYFQKHKHQSGSQSKMPPNAAPVLVFT